MSEPNRDSLYATWRQLAHRHDWALVSDEAAFLNNVVAEWGTLSGGMLADEGTRIALLRAYGVLLYNGLQKRQDRAAHEIWLACYRLALRDGWPVPEAEWLAQETIARVLDKLDTLRSPQSIISWTLRICRTVRTSFKKQSQAEQPIQTEEQDASTLIDEADMALEVELRLVNQQLHDLLRTKLANDLERQVLLRVVICGDHPRDVARELGLPLYRTRVAKSRALQRLRNDEQFLQLLGELAGEATDQLPGAGVDNDDTEDTEGPTGGGSSTAGA